MYQWNIFLLMIIFTCKLQYIEMQEGRVLSLDCSLPKRKYDVTVMLLKTSENCAPPGRLSCKVMASEILTSLRMRGTKSPYNTEAIFPVNTWKERELEMILDNSEVILAPNTTAYRYNLPRAFETVSGRGFVDVECNSLTAPMPATSPVNTDNDTSPNHTASGSFSALQIVLIVLAVLVFLALTIFVAFFLIRKHLLRGEKSPAKPRKVKKKRFALAKSRTSTVNKYSTDGNLGIPVYVDPAAPNEYDNKHESTKDIGNSSSGEYTDLCTAANNSSGKEPDNNSQKYSYTALESRKFGNGNQPGKNTPKYSYAYMDTTATTPHHSNGENPTGSNENTEIPYEDVESDAYSYAYGATSRPTGNNI